jgi:hypothetical protein
MTMNLNERQQVKTLLRAFDETGEPLPGNMAVFYDQSDVMVYAGIIEDWPFIIATDIEWGKVERKDTSQEPFAGKKVKFFSPRAKGFNNKSPVVH